MKTIEKKYLVPFCLVTVLFLLWGMANNMTDTLLSAFKRIMSMTDTQTSLIQFAFYGSYFCFALPAALFIRKYSYKSGVILGLVLYAAGAILFFPASKAASYAFYLIAIYILAGGCSILETTANPYILSMGSPETATRRLNIAQAFNPLGSITGILMSQFFILSQLSSATADERAAMTQSDLTSMQAHELSAVTGTYMTLGFVLLAIMVVMLLVKMPEGGDDSRDSVMDSFKRLIKNRKYVFGVVAQFFYVGAQICVWSFTIRIVMKELGLLEADAATYYLIGIIGFSAARFLFTWLMKWIQPSKLLLWASAADIVLCLIVALCSGTGLLCIVALIGVSFFMSLMFPTIYGIALDNVGQDAKIGASGLIMAILGGAVITPIQGIVSDATNINISYLVPMVCFVVVLMFAMYVGRQVKKA
ncbi:MAG: L-fucose:H+ symporter permease [Salinivirgaceae bacterium]|nr:L-fucose:H+ symporter permease [Salinivirgaceae bacterium]